LNNETTNRLSIDANQDKPRIILRQSKIVTSSATAYAPTWLSGQDFLILSEIKASVNTLIEVYMKDNQTNYVYAVPLITGNSSGQFVLNANYQLLGYDDGGVYKQYILFEVNKRNGAATDTYTFYVVVYSTQVTDLPIQTS